MGSTGTGRLSDYSGTERNKEGGGGSDGEDRCSRAFSAELEEVERCDFYQNHGNPPAEGMPVQLLFEKRPTIASVDGELIGYLPTRFNYLRACISDGFSYGGNVSESNSTPIVSVVVDVAPE